MIPYNPFLTFKIIPIMKKAFLSLAMLIAMIASLTACSDAKAQSNDPYQNEIEKMLELTNAREVMVTTMVNLYTNMHLPVCDINGLSEAIVDGIWDDYVTECVVPVYKKYFSFDEVKALNDFYGTPLGEKLAKNNSQIINECSQLTSEKLTGRIQDIVMDYLK